jgi:hypothetical protein
MIVEMTGRGVLPRDNIASRVRPPHPEARVCREPIILEVQVVLDQKRSAERVVSHPIPAHPRIREGQREKENEEQDPVVLTEPNQ